MDWQTYGRKAHGFGTRTLASAWLALTASGCGGAAAGSSQASTVPEAVDVNSAPALPERGPGGPVEFNVEKKTAPKPRAEKAHGNSIMQSFASAEPAEPLRVPNQCAQKSGGNQPTANGTPDQASTNPTSSVEHGSTQHGSTQHSLVEHLPAAPEPVESVPTQSKDATAQTCIPPQDFVKRLCARGNPSVALSMFAKGTPWERLYITGLTEAWDVAGGATSSGKLLQHEEVLVLQKEVVRDGEIQVGGEKSLYALRWGGGCVMLTESQVTAKVPYRTRYAPIEWNWLETPIQESLRQDPGVNAAYRARRSECKGSSFGSSNKACRKLEQRLTAAIVAYVRGGGDLAQPQPVE